MDKIITEKRHLIILIPAIVFTIIFSTIGSFICLGVVSLFITGLPPQIDSQVIKTFENIQYKEWLSGEEFYYLYDTKNEETIFDSLSKMFVENNYIYARGQMAYGIHKSNLDENTKYYFTGQINDELQTLYFDNKEDMPDYVKINYTTGNQEWFYTLDEITEEDREMFEKDLGWWCKLKKTCYEE